MLDRELKQNVKGLSQRALERFARRAQKATGLSGDIQVLITSNHRLRELNRRFRKKDAATDVLSFPASQSRYRGQDARRRNQVQTGDIAISAEIAMQQAKLRGHPVAHEIKVLILHGMLHLAGFDHETDHGTMARKEERLRHRLGLRDGLIRRAETASDPLLGRSRRQSAVRAMKRA